MEPGNFLIYIHNGNMHVLAKLDLIYHFFFANGKENYGIGDHLIDLIGNLPFAIGLHSPCQFGITFRISNISRMECFAGQKIHKCRKRKAISSFGTAICMWNA